MSTPRTSRADRNYLSISEDTTQWYLGTSAPEPLNGPIPKDLVPSFPADWDAILKVSDNAREVTLADMRIAQGRENAIDCNHGASYITIEGDLGWGGGEGDQVITIKGGSHDITIAATIHSRGRNADVVIGAWSDQSTDRSSYLNLTQLARDDGKPVTFIISRADRGTISLPPRAKVLWWKSLAYTAYWYLKRAWVALRY